jgi:predicted nuclease of predicted toxin-antitoxin system
MDFIADECVDRQIVDRLREDGHGVFYVAEIDAGISDDVVLERANQKGVFLLTADKDFGELIFRQGRAFTGVLLLRLAGLPQMEKAEIVSTVIRDHANEFFQSFTVVSPGMIRIRKGI